MLDEGLSIKSQCLMMNLQSDHLTLTLSQLMLFPLPRIESEVDEKLPFITMWFSAARAAITFPSLIALVPCLRSSAKRNTPNRFTPVKDVGVYGPSEADATLGSTLRG